MKRAKTSSFEIPAPELLPVHPIEAINIRVRAMQKYALVQLNGRGRDESNGQPLAFDMIFAPSHDFCASHDQDDRMLAHQRLYIDFR
eukprot:g35455.t1